MPSSPPRRAMTVLQIIPTLVTGGAERTTIDIAAALAARGDRALVASEGGRLVDELKSVGGEFVRMPVSWKNPVAVLANARRIAAPDRAASASTSCTREAAPRPGRRCSPAAAPACPFVTTYHGIYGETNALKRLYNSVMVRGAAVIANSRYTARPDPRPLRHRARKRSPSSRAEPTSIASIRKMSIRRAATLFASAGGSAATSGSS